VRERMVSRLANVDPKIAERVAKGLALTGPVKPAPARGRESADPRVRFNSMEPS
jgi:hypothetical protein